MKYKVKVLNNVSKLGLKLLAEGGIQYSSEETLPDAILLRSAKLATKDYPSLLAVGRAGAGVNNISIQEASDDGVCVFNSPGANANAVAELVFTMLGFGARNIDESSLYVQNLDPNLSDEEISKQVEVNKSRFKGFELSRKTLAVIGLGQIGVRVCNYGIHQEMTVKAYDPYPTISNIHHLDREVQIKSNLEQVLAGADVVSVHVPLIEQTKNLIGDSEIEKVNQDCILLNFSRDGIYSDNAVEKALEKGKISKYISDFPKKRFLSNKDVVLVPHLGASTEESEENCAIMVSRQVRHYLNYGNVINSVNFPAIEIPLASSVVCRLIVVNHDIPNMIALITQIIGESNLNIQSFNNESNGKIGYNIIDLGSKVSDSVIEKIQALDNVIRVRLLAF